MSFLYNNFIVDGFEWILEFVHNNLIGNYLIVVLLMTILVKVILTPVDIKQRESSMKMLKIQPKINEMKKRYPDPMAQNQKLKELYRKEDIHMTAGCLPSILQFVILIAFFGAIQRLAYNQTVALVARAAANPGAPIELEGLLWVRNIWQPDSGSAFVMPSLAEWTRILKNVTPEVAATVANIDYQAVIQPTLNAYSGLANGWYILPIIQGVTMYFSMGYSLSTTAASDNPMGGPIMKIAMAGMTTWFCLTANTLFTIYWILTNLLMFAQTYFFKRYFEYKENKQTAINAG